MTGAGRMRKGQSQVAEAVGREEQRRVSARWWAEAVSAGVQAALG